jgi:hypothetical protein
MAASGGYCDQTCVADDVVVAHGIRNHSRAHDDQPRHRHGHDRSGHHRRAVRLYEGSLLLGRFRAAAPGARTVLREQCAVGCLASGMSVLS